MFKITSGQIKFKISKTDVACNNSTLGSIEINIDELNPPYTYQWSSGGTTPTISNLIAGAYTVTIMDGLANDTSITIAINEIECEMIPEIIFTPNGDGYNDTWFISNYQFYPNAKILVFNRWGQKVHEQKGLYESWDGKDLFGIPVPDASYYFIVQKDKDDKKSLVKGSVSIIR